ncbi:MAG: hypothetical protein ACFFDU_01925 [Candidatus Thorarchaeota archaeon]
MDRSLISVLAGVFTVSLFTLIAGITLIDIAIRMWLIPLGFVLACLIIGVVGRLRVLHLLLISFLIYLGLIVFLAVSSTLSGLEVPPLSLDAVVGAWIAFQSFVNTTIPFLSILSILAAALHEMAGGSSVLAIFLEFFVAFLFIGIIGFMVTGIAGHATRAPGLYVATAPEPTAEPPAFPEPTAAPAAPVASAPPVVPQGAPAPPVPPTVEAPPMPAPRPVEEASPPPPPPSKGGSPSAQAISGLKGKVKKHLKGTGRQAPTGQSRCPHCNATIIHGSRFCNACQKEIKG